MLQKYRADKRGKAAANGAVPFYAQWMGGASLALIRNCPANVGEAAVPARTVYVQGEADTFFSVPAACRYKGKDIRGFLTWTDSGPEFHGYVTQG